MTLHFRPEVIHQLKWFKDSPDTGDPACICSFCGKVIEEGEIPLRVWQETGNMEFRLHIDCARQVIQEFQPKKRVSDARNESDSP